MKPTSLQIQQLNNKIKGIDSLRAVPVPHTGWLKAVRVSIGMSLEQLGRKLGISKQSALAMERREQEGAVTLQTLRDAAAVMDMELVYGFVPKDGSIDQLIDRKAKEVAQKIVGMASQSMILENQANSAERLARAIEERALVIKEKTPRLLWD